MGNLKSTKELEFLLKISSSAIRCNSSNDLLELNILDIQMHVSTYILCQLKIISSYFPKVLMDLLFIKQYYSNK